MSHGVLGNHDGSLTLHLIVTLDTKIEKLRGSDTGAVEDHALSVGEVEA